MLRGGTVAELAAEMTDSRKSSILLLGSGFARRAGVPGVEDVARWLLESEEEDSSKVVEAFRGRLQQMSALERYSLFRAFYRSQPVPAVYREVARIIRDGQFCHVLTCSVDLLLEEAMKGVGLQPGDDYQIVDPLISSAVAIDPPSEGERLLPIVRLHEALAPGEIENLLELTARTFKLPSQVLVVGYDLECEQVDTLLSQFSGAIWWVGSDPAISERIASFGLEWDLRIIPADVSNLIAFFGDLMEALLSASPAGGPPVKELRAESRREPTSKGLSPRTKAAPRGRDEMSETRTPHDKSASTVSLTRTQRKQETSVISPPSSGEVKELLTQFSTPEGEHAYKTGHRTEHTPLPSGAKDKLRHKESAQKEKWADYILASPEFSQEVTSAKDLEELRDAPRPAKDSSAKESRREESLRQQLRESREILAKLERQEFIRGEWDAQQLQSEIAYQRDQIARLEREWSRLPSIRRRLEETLRAIIEAAVRAQTKPEVKRFLRYQAAIVSEEQEREEPNEDVIAAAIGATVLLTRRLGDRVDQGLVQELASLMLGGIGGRV
jgi:hypothetical protein